MINCEEAKIICHKTQYQDASFLEIVKLKFHLLICKTCSVFSRKNTKLTTLCEEATLYSLSDKEKSNMKERLENNL